MRDLLMPIKARGPMEMQLVLAQCVLIMHHYIKACRDHSKRAQHDPKAYVI
jgi:hypothetical protein